MAEESSNGAEREAEGETDELLYTGLTKLDYSSKQDHCDLLLDAIDDQLSRLQVQNQKHDSSNEASLSWSQLVSKDTGLSTTQTSDVSHLHFAHQATEARTTDRRTGFPSAQRQAEDRPAGVASRREQCIWRLEKLLGDGCGVSTGLAAEPRPPSDSVCTEDFARRFTEEMAGLASLQRPSNEGREAAQAPSGGSAAHSTQDKVRRGHAEDLDERPLDIRELRVSCQRGETGTGERCSTRGRLGYMVANSSTLPDTPVSELSEQTRALLAVPMWSFDTVSFDSDLQAKQHVSRSGCLSVSGFVWDMDDLCTDHSDSEAPSQEPGRCQYTSGLASRNEDESVRYSCLRKEQHNRRPPSSEHTAVGGGHVLNRSTGQVEKCAREQEVRLERQTAQLSRPLVSLSDVEQQQRKELGRLCEETTQMEREKQSLETSLRASRAETDASSCQLRMLQRKRDSCLQEIRSLEEELATRRMAVKDTTYVEKPSVIVSVWEREEIERQLDNAKTELFTEQRRSRDKLDSMLEKLEEAREELERVTEEGNSLRNRCEALEKKLRGKQEQMEALDVRVGELQEALWEHKERAGSLEKTLAQKELRLLQIQEERNGLQAERDSLQGALQDQEHKHCTERRQATMKDEEVRKMKESLQKQKEALTIREKEMHAEASEKVCEAIAQERRRWEAEELAAVMAHRGKLEEEHREMRRRLEREKRKALLLQNKVVELRRRGQEVEAVCRATQEKQEGALAALRTSLNEEHQAELQRLCRQMNQGSQRKILKLDYALQLAEEGADKLRMVLEEQESSHKQNTAELEQQLIQWAQQLEEEVQHLRLLLDQDGARGSMPLPHSPTVAMAVKNLQALREQLQLLIGRLHHDLDTQIRTVRELSHDQERELLNLRRQMWMQREQALDSLKERLIQERTEGLSSPSRAQVCGGGGEAGGLATSPQANVQQLRQVQRTTRQWREQAAARPAHRFEDKLTEEERKPSKAQEESQKKMDFEGAIRHISRECSNSGSESSMWPPYLHSGDSGPSDMASFKLLCHLQDRVRQLRAENKAYLCSPSTLSSF